MASLFGAAVVLVTTAQPITAWTAGNLFPPEGAAGVLVAALPGFIAGSYPVPQNCWNHSDGSWQPVLRQEVATLTTGEPTVVKVATVGR